MSSPTDRPDGHVAAVVSALLTAHQHLGDEALALAQATQQVLLVPQAAAVRRSQSGLAEAATRPVGIIEMFLALHAMERLEVDGASCRSANGRPVTNLPGLDCQEAQLGKALFILNSLIEHLDTKVFAEPKRRSDLTHTLARSPHRTGIALLALRDAVLSAGQAAAERKMADDAEKCTALAAAIEQLETRVCSRPAPPLTADQVVAAMRSDPAIAEAVSQALHATAAAG